MFSEHLFLGTPLGGWFWVIYNEALNSLISSSKERFDQLCFKVYENLESLLLKSLPNESIANEIEYVKCVYKGDLDVDQLVVELQMLKLNMPEWTFWMFWRCKTAYAESLY